MTSDVICEDWPLISWNARVLFQVLPVQSPIFNIRDMVCHLYFDEKPVEGSVKGYFELILKGRSTESPEFVSFYTKTHIIDMHQTNRFEEDNVVTRSGTSFEYCIWRLNKQRLLVNRYDMVGDCEWLNFVCYFGPSKENPPFKKTELELRKFFKNSTTVDIMSSDYMKLLNNDKMADVTIVCKDRNIKAHKIILSARCKTFAEILQKEVDGVIDMSDMESSEMYSILSYIYTGKLPEITLDNMYGIYDASHRFQLYALRLGCANFMISELNVNKSLRCLNYAQRCNDIMFKLSIVAFIRFSKLFIKADIWRRIAKQVRNVTSWSLDDENFLRTLPKITIE